MKPLSKTLCVSLCVVLLLAVSLVTPTMARYSNTASTATPYGDGDGFLNGQTLSAAPSVYDFGVYTRGVDAGTFTHTVRVVDAALTSGILRFSWDDTTRVNRDIAVHIDSAYYSSVQNSGYVDYTVAAADGVLEIPFSLLFSSPAPRTATLDVSFYPDGSDEPTLFARYLLAVVDEETEGTTPTFVAEHTAFLSDALLMATVTTPESGVWLSPADGTFAAGTRYCAVTCADGAVLVRDSAIYLPRTADTAKVYVDLSATLSGTRPVTLRVAASDTAYSDTACVPAAQPALTVSLSDTAGLLSAQRPLTVTLTACDSLQDFDWQIFRREGDDLLPVTVGEHLTVTAAQNALTLATPDGAQPAGTYLLVVTQYYQDYPVSETPIWFFIDYR